MAKRQTIWLSTMMVLSLMLIGWYTVDNDVKEVPTDAKQQAQNAAEKNTPQFDESDWFVSYHIEETQRVSEKTEQLQTVIANSKSKEEVEKAQKELEDLRANTEKVENATDLILAEGYHDAAIEIKDNKVNVVVMAQELDKNKAVKIMSLVAKELGVSSRNVVVSHRE